MDDALIGDESRSSSQIALVRTVSRVSNLSLAASLSSSLPEQPASNPSGSDGNNAALASGKPVEANPSGSAAATGAAISDEDVSKLDLAIMSCSIGLLMPIAITISSLGWEPRWKVLYGSLMIVSFVLTIAGFLTAWSPAVKWARRLSPYCARSALIVAAALFVVFLSCRLARFGCVAGEAAAAAVVVILVLVWVLSELPPPTRKADAAGSLPPGMA